MTLLFHPDDTIFAQATATGASPRGIVRISGPDSLRLLAPIFRRPNRAVPAGPYPFSPRETPSEPVFFSGELTVFGPNRPLPVRVYVWPKGHGFTGQLAVELHLPGGKFLTDRVLRYFLTAGKPKEKNPAESDSPDAVPFPLLKSGTIRLAEPGEFTLRAFLAGKIDLTQAEAVLGVIDAKEGKSLETALEQLAGNLAEPLARLREDLLETLVEIEAGLDFAEEEVEFLSQEELRERIRSSRTIVEQTLRRMEGRLDNRNEIRVVLTGKPNAGKSSLFNRLAERFSTRAKILAENLLSPTEKEAGPNDPPPGVLKTPALVSDEAGTTRDWLETPLFLGSISATLLDTAGVRGEGEKFASPSPSQKTGSASEDSNRLRAASEQKSGEAARQADLLLRCVESARFLNEKETGIEANRPLKSPPSLLVLTKIDKLTDSNRQLLAARLQENANRAVPTPLAILTSAETGFGLTELAAAIRRQVVGEGKTADVVPSTAVRCRKSLQDASDSLQRAETILDQMGDEVLLATEIRSAADAVGLVTGAVSTDDLLDRIFSRFCIGK